MVGARRVAALLVVVCVAEEDAAARRKFRMQEMRKAWRKREMELRKGQPWQLHARVATSPAFCFPAAPDDPLRCDLVQFVSSLSHDARDPDSLLVAFGVNDCESAYVQLPVALVLAFTLGCRDRHRRTDVLGHLRAAEARVNATEASWNATRGRAWDALLFPDHLPGDARPTRRRPANPPPPFAFRRRRAV